MNDKHTYIEIVPASPVPGRYTYSLPQGMLAEIGRRVTVPFGRQRLTGYVAAVDVDIAGIDAVIKPIIAVLDDAPLFTSQMLELFQWTAEYYKYPLGLVIEAALPGGKSKPGQVKTEQWARLTPNASISPHKLTPARIKILDILATHPALPLKELLEEASVGRGVVTKLVELGLAELYEERVYRDPLGFAIAPDKPLTLNLAQAYALKKIVAGLEKSPKPFLLQGVTGSGKTEVYLQAAQTALNKGRGVLVLVPEIALITQTEHRFRARFGDNIAILHSGLTLGERYDQWSKIAKGEVAIVLGARSAVFAPLQNLGLIIVDEEHDGSYKQESNLKYNARDVAIVRGQQLNIPVILGSATPALQTMQNAQAKRFTHLVLPERINAQKLAEIEVIDLRHDASPNKMITRALQTAIGQTLAAGEQVLLFINRRGFTPSLLCKDCGETLTCPNCDISLTYHKNKNAALCHFCGHTKAANAACDKCQSVNVIPFGVGIQRVEEHVRAMFPHANVARLDRDTATDRKTMLKIFRELQQGTIDILIGTQMVAKGHDFPNITLVGIISADLSLSIPDFRSDEVTFQLLTQVAGRSGRGTKAGRVILQTYNPDHFVIKAAKAQDFTAFFNHEVENRAALGYPPFTRIAQVRINAKTAALACEIAQKLGAASKQYCGKVTVLGPVEAPISKLANWHRWHLMYKSKSANDLHKLVDWLIKSVVPELESDKVRITVDIDPMNML